MLNTKNIEDSIEETIHSMKSELNYFKETKNMEYFIYLAENYRYVMGLLTVLGISIYVEPSTPHSEFLISVRKIIEDGIYVLRRNNCKLNLK